LQLKDQGKVFEAEKLLRLVSDATERDVAANSHMHLGVMFHRQRRLKEAEEEYRWVMKNAKDPEAARAAANLGIMLHRLAHRYSEAAEAYIEAIDRGDEECGMKFRNELGVLYDHMFPELIKQGDGNALLSLSIRINRKGIATSRVLAGVVLGVALTGQWDGARSLLGQFQQLEARQLNEIQQIFTNEIPPDSAAGRALRRLQQADAESEHS